MIEELGEADWAEARERLWRFVAARVGDEHDAEDVLQEVLFKAYAAVGYLEDEAKVSAWLYRIARNAIVDHYRAHGGTPGTVGMPEGVPEPLTAPENANPEMLGCLSPMIDELPEGYRKALVLKEFEGKTQAEVAGELGLSLSGAKSRVQRARVKLKATFSSCCSLELDRRGNILNYRRKEKASRYCA